MACGFRGPWFLRCVGGVRDDLDEAPVVLIKFLRRVSAFFALVFLVARVDVARASNNTRVPVTSRRGLVAMASASTVGVSLVARIFRVVREEGQRVGANDVMYSSRWVRARGVAVRLVAGPVARLKLCRRRFRRFVVTMFPKVVVGQGVRYGLLTRPCFRSWI